MKILIIGGGIGGLAAANFLERKGFDVTLIERAPEFKHIGFGMTIWSNGRRLLREIGIDDKISKDGYELPWFELIDTHGRLVGQKIDFSDFKKYGEPPIAIERATLHEALVKNLKNTKLKLGTTVADISQNKDLVHVELSDGTKHTFDLVVASDGIHSSVREKFFGKSDNKYYGWSLRFFWVPAGTPIPEGSVCLSKGKITLAIYPIGRKRGFVGIYEYNPARTEHPPLNIDSFLPYLLKHGWTKEHIDSLRKEALEGHQYYDHLQHISPGKWFKKRIVLLGDSRHGLSPLTGMGAGMALEDAYVLADELVKVDNTRVSIALANYEKRRIPHIKNIVSLSKFVERFFLVKSKSQKTFLDLMSKFVSKKVLMQKYEKVLGEPL